MRQWSAAKRENPDALLFFRMGDFYELFYDDAVTASRELQLTLTARDREALGKLRTDVRRSPSTPVEGYLRRALLSKGYRIAICDQMEDPKLTKKIVKARSPRACCRRGRHSMPHLARNEIIFWRHTSKAVPKNRQCVRWRCSTSHRRRAFVPRVPGTEGPATGAGGAVAGISPSEVLLPSSAETPRSRSKTLWRVHVSKTGFGRAILPCRWWSASCRCGRLRASGSLATNPLRLPPAFFCITCAPRRKTKHCTSIHSNFRSTRPRSNWIR